MMEFSKGPDTCTIDLVISYLKCTMGFGALRGKYLLFRRGVVLSCSEDHL